MADTPEKQSAGWDQEQIMPPLAKPGQGQMQRPPIGPGRVPLSGEQTESTVSSTERAPSTPPSRDRLRPSDAEAAVRALTLASLKLRRGQTTDARLELAPLLDVESPSAQSLEMLGDIEMADGKFDAASEAFRRALKAEPGRPTAEMKLGRAALEQSTTGRSVRQTLPAARPFALNATGQAERRRAAVATICSLILPGLGQCVNGQYLKGAAVIAGLLALFGGLLGSPDVRNLSTHLKVDYDAVLGQSGAIPTTPSFSGIFWLCLAGITGLVIYSVVDAYIVALRPIGSRR